MELHPLLHVFDVDERDDVGGTQIEKFSSKFYIVCYVSPFSCLFFKLFIVFSILGSRHFSMVALLCYENLFPPGEEKIAGA